MRHLPGIAIDLGVNDLYFVQIRPRKHAVEISGLRGEYLIQRVFLLLRLQCTGGVAGNKQASAKQENRES